jgi:hypothetical protein
MAPVEFIGRYMKGWFDLAIADELHQLAGLSAGPNYGEEHGQPAIRALQGEYWEITGAAFLHIICCSGAGSIQSESSQARSSWSRFQRGGLVGRTATFSSASRFVSKLD